MRTVLIVIIILGSFIASAQNYYKQYEIPADFIAPFSRMNTTQHLMADGNFILGNFNDSMANIQKINGATGDIIFTRTIDTRVKLSIPDTGRYISSSLFYPTQDTGVIIYYNRLNGGNSMDPGSYSSIIKLNKNLKIQWSFFCRNTDKIFISYKGIASDVSGATYLSYMNLNDTSLGICKVTTDGIIAIDKQSGKRHVYETGYASLYGSMLALEGNRLMVISESDYFSTVLDTSLNVIRSYHFSFGDKIVANFRFNVWSKPVYKQQLIAATANGFFSYKPGYFLMDTTGRLLKIDTSSTSISLLGIAINENNHLVMLSGAPAGSGYTIRLQAMDTSKRILFTRGFSSLYNGSSLLLSGKDAYWLSCANVTSAKSNNVMRFESSKGYGFCEGSTDMTSLVFDGRIPVKNDLVSTLPLKNGNFRCEKSFLDSVVSPSVAIIHVCDLPTDIKTAQKPDISVYSSGGQQINVTVPDVSNRSSFVLRDITGRQVYAADINTPNSTLQLPYIVPGIYIWYISGNNNGVSGKIFIE